MVNTEQGPTTMVNLIYIPVHSNISVCILPVELITTKATFSLEQNKGSHYLSFFIL